MMISFELHTNVTVLSYKCRQASQCIIERTSIRSRVLCKREGFGFTARVWTGKQLMRGWDNHAGVRLPAPLRVQYGVLPALRHWHSGSTPTPLLERSSGEQKKKPSMTNRFVASVA